jgi:hypothetical protein
MDRAAKANVDPLRQRTQYTCMSASMCMALRALGLDCSEDEVNKVMGARPMKGATWEHALACGQHYGMRCTLTVPATLGQLRAWTDAGVPVMIAWNPEGRPWSHASLVFDVDADDNVHVADPNIPDPEETVRVVSKADFYRKWYEEWPNYLVRRPAMAIEREVTPDGQQRVASVSSSRSVRLATVDRRRIVARHGTVAYEAWGEYVDAVMNLEVGADQVVVATRKLRSLGLEPRHEDYPFTDDIDVVASDIYRWRGSVSSKASPDTSNSEGMTDAMRRVAALHLAKRKP